MEKGQVKKVETSGFTKPESAPNNVEVFSAHSAAQRPVDIKVDDVVEDMMDYYRWGSR